MLWWWINLGSYDWGSRSWTKNSGQRSAEKVLDFMIESGVDLNAESAWTPLDEALYWSNIEIAATLVARGARIRALSTAAGLGDIVVTSNFFDTNGLQADAGPIGSPFPDTVGELGDDAASIIDHAFVMAANTGCQEAAALLLEKGARTNSIPPGYHWKGTALHAAVWRGDRPIVEWLLASGADPTIRDGLAHSDALGWARHHKHPALVDLLTK
ncbi:MAG: hypothetical protein ACI8TP_001664 [Acidimicrobiales bacterium]|jgi:hypothetical protein